MQTKIAIVGLGYVGLPLAVEFAKHFSVTGFDVVQAKIEQLKHGIDPAGEVSKEELTSATINYTTDPKELSQVSFIIVAVPTPIDDQQQPDLNAVRSASETVGKYLTKGAIVVYESTVYPGVTEEVCIPILEKTSNMKCGIGFFVGYSPERINPGDKEHYLTKIVKIVSGMNPEITEKIAQLYGIIIKPGVYKASSIKVAEAAKVIENSQRDLNIALMNELALIFNKLGISTKEVIDAASTKWNFHRYIPGLVGGHCISVDPHYLLYKAKQMGYNPKVILAGRDVNEYMPKYVAEMVFDEFRKAGVLSSKSSVLVLGLTFKDNVKDMRNSKIKITINELKKRGITVYGHDPLISIEEVKGFGVEPVSLQSLPKVHAIIIARNHIEYQPLTLPILKQHMACPVLIDLGYKFTKQQADNEKIAYRSL